MPGGDPPGWDQAGRRRLRPRALGRQLCRFARRHPWRGVSASPSGGRTALGSGSFAPDVQPRPSPVDPKGCSPAASSRAGRRWSTRSNERCQIDGIATKSGGRGAPGGTAGPGPGSRSTSGGRGSSRARSPGARARCPTCGVASATCRGPVQSCGFHPPGAGADDAGTGSASEQPEGDGRATAVRRRLTWR